MVFSQLTTPQRYQSYMTVEDCPYCHETRGEEITQNPKVVKCAVCGLYRLYPRMSREGQIAMLKEYDDKINPVQSVPLNEKQANNFYYFDMNHIKKEFPEVFRGGKVLDVGTSEGSFVAALNSMGAQASGLEPNDRIAAAGRKNGLDINSGRFDADGIPGKVAAAKFDLVSFRESFYYMFDLRDTFTLLNSCLKPNGSIYLKCSSAESYHPSTNRDYSKRYGLYVSGMLTQQSLAYIFEHEGYKVTKIENFHHLPYLGRFPFNYAYMLLFRFIKKGNVEEIMNKLYYSHVDPIGPGTGMILYAKKV